MPNYKRLTAILLAVLSAAVCFVGCSGAVENDEIVSIEAPCETLPPSETEIPAERFSKREPILNIAGEVTDSPIPTFTPAPTAASVPAPASMPKPTPMPTPKPTPKPTPVPMTEMNYVPGYTNEAFVNFRNEPNTKAEILRVCRYGTELFVTGRTPEWFRVVIEDKTGYIARPYVTCGYLVTPTPAPPPMYTVKPGQFSDYEISLVAALLHKEGPGSTKKGYRAIASVILNRVMNKSGWFPNDVAGVLFQQGQFGYSREELEETKPNSVALKAAQYVFSTHGSVLPKKVLFYRAAYLGKKWASYMSYYATIEGNCYFYGKYYY